MHVCIHVISKLPPHIIKQIQETNEKRFYYLSSDGEILNEPVPFFKD